MASNVVRMSPAGMPPQPSQQDWMWDGANWVWCGPPFPSPPSCPPPLAPPFPCPPPGFPTPCPPWFPPPAAQAPWYPGANGGVSFSATPPVNPVRGHFWWDGTMLHLFDGAVWVNIGPTGAGGSGGPLMGVVDGSSAAVGVVGEVIKLTSTGTVNVIAPPGSPATNFTALVVPPGDWNIQGTATVTDTTSGSYWDYITFTLLSGSTTLGSFQIAAQFTSSAGGITGGTYSCAVIPLSVSTSTTVSCALQVVGVPGGVAGTASYSFLCQGRRMR